VLSAQSEDAAEREALGRLQDLLPDETTAHLLTPQAWHERRTALIAECTEERRTLFLFDQELKVDDAGLGFHKGSDIIRDMAEKERAGFGTRWFCGMLTHTVDKGEEVASWRSLEKSEKLDLRFFMPIAKATLDDAPAFYGAVYRTLVNTYSQTMKSLAADAFEKALEDALMERVRAEDLTLVTNNARDFRRLFAREPIHAGLILILPQVPPARQRELLDIALTEIGAADLLVNEAIEINIQAGAVAISRFEFPVSGP
jgi:hypothetical protein